MRQSLVLILLLASPVCAVEGPMFRVASLPRVTAGQKIAIDVELENPKEGVVFFYELKAASPSDAQIELEKSPCGTKCYGWAGEGAFEIRVRGVLKMDAEAVTEKIVRIDVDPPTKPRPLPRPVPTPPPVPPEPPEPPTPPVPPVPPTPPPIPPGPDTFGIRMRVIADAKAIGDPAGCHVLADKADLLAKRLKANITERARAAGLGQPGPPAITVQSLIPDLAAAIKGLGPKWSPFVTMTGTEMKRLFDTKALSLDNPSSFATFLEEVSLALKQAAQ